MLCLPVSGSHLYWMIFLDYVLSVWVSFKSVLPLGGHIKVACWDLWALSLLGVPPLFSFLPASGSLYTLSPRVCLSSPLSFPLPFPSCCLFPVPIWSWNTDRKASGCLARALCQKKWNRSNYKKRMKKECSLAKWGKQMFRSGFAVSGCELKHLPYRIARYRHSSSCHMCGCFKIKSVYVYALVSA